MSFSAGFAAGLAVGKKKWGDGSGGGDDKYDYYTDDPDWELFKNTPEPSDNQFIFAIRIIDPSYRKAGSYYTDWYVTDTVDGHDIYAAVSETKVDCNVKINLPNHSNYFDDPDMWEFPSYEIDWGDGTVTSFEGGVGRLSPNYLGADGYDGGINTTSSHVYSEKGTYIVTCTIGLKYPKSGNETGNYAVRVHDSNVYDNYKVNAPITVFAKVGKGIGRHMANAGKNHAASQITSFGMRNTIKFLSGNFAKMGFNYFSGCTSLKYLKTDCIRSINEQLDNYDYDNPIYSYECIDLSPYQSQCLERIDITGETYSGECTGILTTKTTNGIIDVNRVPFKYYSTNDVNSDDRFPLYDGYFRECRALKKLPQEILNVRNFKMYYTFQNCISLTSINMPNCENLPNYAFSGCSALKKISLPNLKIIPDYCFQSCTALTDVDIEQCTSVSAQAFSGCNALFEINFKECNSIGNNAIPRGNGSCLKKISLPKITEINFVCQDNYALTEVDCPLCTSVADYAFQSCYSLCIFKSADNCTYGSNCFNGCYSLYPRPDGSVN